MRDLVLTFVVFASIPIIFRRPEVGVLMWTWLSLMSPHRLTWGFAGGLPFSQLVGIALLIGLFLWKEPKKLPWSPLLVVWVLFVLWMCVTTIFALNPEGAFYGWDKSMKIQIVSLIILVVMTTRTRLIAFVWTIALSIGFYGIKGGIFTLKTGGNALVFGPRGSFIEENNALALAIIVIIPLFRFLQLYHTDKWVRRGLFLAMVLCVFSVLGSSSRGAFLALLSMGFFFLLKSRNRAPVFLALLLLVPLALSFVPDKYWDRMSTIETFEQDGSAMGRINAWGFAINVANDRPLVGGGFDVFTPYFNRVYAPDPSVFADVHSIYFEVLGEQGYVGLFLFLLFAFLTYQAARWTALKAQGDPDLQWHADLARMCQVSMVGYATGGAFLGLAYFDLLYDIAAVIVLNRLLLQKALAERSDDRSADTPPPGNGVYQASSLSVPTPGPGPVR